MAETTPYTVQKPLKNEKPQQDEQDVKEQPDED